MSNNNNNNDSEVINKDKKKNSNDNDNVIDDITSIFGEIGFNTFKIAFIMFIMFIMVSSDVFIDRVLSSNNNLYSKGRVTTCRGVVIQGVVLSIGYIILYTLVHHNYI